MRLLFLATACFVCATACAQSLTLGVKAGAQLTDDLRVGGFPITTPESRRYTLGPSIEFGVWGRLAVEIDAMYKRLGKSSFGGFIIDRYWSRDRENSWELPILAKFRILRRIPGPYVLGGYSFRHIAGSGTTNRFCCIGNYGPPGFTLTSYTVHYNFTSGPVVGGGMEFKLLGLILSPEFRYTRWTDRALDNYGSQGFSQESAQNQTELLVGIGWQARAK